MKPKPVKPSVLRVLGRFGGRSRDLKTGIAIQRSWPAIVGELMSRYLFPVQVRGRKLKIGVTSPVWLAEAEYLKDTLLDNIRQAVGDGVIDEVSFSMLASPPQLPDHARTPASVPLTGDLGPERALRLEHELERIKDPELRERMRRVLTKSSLRYGPG